MADAVRDEDGELANRVLAEYAASLQLEEAVTAERAKSQAFFAQMYAETRKPHFGDMQRSWMAALLNRAIEAGLYRAEEP